MKKLLVLSLALSLSVTSCFAWGWWGNKKDSAKNSASSENVEIQNQGSGYVGTLPDISKSFKTTETQKIKPTFEEAKNFNSSDEIKPIPTENPAFVNIMLKQDKRSPYLNDIYGDILPQLENILQCIDDKKNVQIFNAKVFFFNKTVEYLQNKYAGKPESNYTSFLKLLELNTHSKSVATLRKEAEQYRPYLAYTGAGYLYNENVINQQLEYLKTEIQDTIVILREEH